MPNQAPEQSERDKSSLVIPWLKDQSRTDLDNLPNPDILASEINEKLKSYIESFKYTKKTINGSLALWLCFIQRRKKQNPLMTFRQYRSEFFLIGFAPIRIVPLNHFTNPSLIGTFPTFIF